MSVMIFVFFIITREEQKQEFADAIVSILLKFNFNCSF